MSNKKHELEYTYPPDIQKCKNHSLSMRIFKGLDRDQQKAQCQCCERRIGVKQQTGQCCYDNIKLAFLGPGVPLFFTFIKNSIVLLIILCVVYTAFSLYTNTKSGSCNSGEKCSDVFDLLSIINKIHDSNYLAIQNYILLGFVIIFIFIMQYFRYNFRRVQDEADDMITSPSDYALILRRLPPDTLPTDIQQMVDQRRSSLTPEQRQKTMNLQINNIIMSYSMTQYKKVRIQNIEQFNKLLSDDKHGEFKPKPLPKLEKTASFAIIVFQRQQSKQIFRYKPNIFQKFLQFLWTPCIPKSHFEVKGQRIAIERAPEPDDIVWENSKITMEGAICRKTLYSFFSIILLLIGGGIQFGLAVAQKKTSQDSQTKLIMSSVSSVAVTLINVVIQIFLVFTSHKQRNQTLTQFNTVLMVKISFFQFLNTGIFVVLSNFLADVNGFSLSNGFIFQVTQVMILNAAIPNVTLFVLTYCQIIQKIKRCLVERGTLKKSQAQANEIFQGPAVELPYKYAYIFKTLWLTAFYAPLSPIVVPISAGGLILNYMIQKCLFGRIYASPNTTSSMLNDSAIELLEYFSLILSLGSLIVYMYFFHFQPEQLPLNWSIPIYASIVLSLLNLLLPMDGLNNKLFKMPKDNFVYPNYQVVQNKFEVTYEMTNPGCDCKRKRKRDVFLFNALFQGLPGNQMTGMNLLLPNVNQGPLLAQQNNIYQNSNQNPNAAMSNPFGALLSNGIPPSNPTNPINPNQVSIEMQNLNAPPRLDRLESDDLMNNSLTMDNQKKKLLPGQPNAQNVNMELNSVLPLIPNANQNFGQPLSIPPNVQSNQPFGNNNMNNMAMNLNMFNGQPPNAQNASFQNYPQQPPYNPAMLNNTPGSQAQYFRNNPPFGFGNSPKNNGMGMPNSMGMENSIVAPNLFKMPGPVPIPQQSQRSYSSSRGLRNQLKMGHTQGQHYNNL